MKKDTWKLLKSSLVDCRERKENLQALAKLGAAVDDVVNVNKYQC